jgi:hypothetical protein
MPFRNGAVSYSRFGVLGEFPDAAGEGTLALLGRHVVRNRAVAEEGVSSGWCTGRHVFDTDFTWEHCGFSGAVLCAMRVDTAKVPPEIRRAYVSMAEDERRSRENGADVAGVLSRGARREAKAEAERRCKEEIAEGRYRRIAMTPVLLDLVNRTVLAPVSGDAALKELRGLVEGTYGCKLNRRSAGGVAADLMGARGMTSDLDDALPDAFTAPPAQAAAMEGGAAPGRASGRPEVPWALAGGEPRDFLGNVFLLWLWWMAEENEGVVETKDVTVAVLVDKVVDLECPWGTGGRTSLRGVMPTRVPEAGKALQSGKWPRRLGLLLAAHGQEFECVLQGDRFAVSGLKLGDPSEEARTQRLEVEERLDRLATFDKVLVGLYDHFLRERFGKGWATRRQQIAAWIASRTPEPAETAAAR